MLSWAVIGYDATLSALAATVLMAFAGRRRRSRPPRGAAGCLAGLGASLVDIYLY